MASTGSSSKDGRRFWCPQVVQTSQMDCGPAAVKALLEGYRIEAAYGRLREACQTDVDGTSIGALETLIRQLGLEVEQVMEPVDHVLLRPDRLPVIAVVVSGSGLTHYVVAWRLFGGRLQVMDPATGRRAVRPDAFTESLYRHQHPVEAAAWRDWAQGEDFTDPLTTRLRRLGVDAAEHLQEALADADWRPLAALDAATRLLDALTARGAVQRTDDNGPLLRSLIQRGMDDAIPERFWSVRPHDHDGMLWLRGAVLLRITGRRPEIAEHADGPLPQSMLQAIRQGDGSPWRLLLDVLGRQGRRLLTYATLGAVTAALLVAFEALLLLGLIRAADQFQGLGQLPAAIFAVLAFVGGITALEFAVIRGARHLGRDLEIQVRTAFLHKIPRLADRFFESRLRSDMAERAHSVAGLRQLPQHVAGLAGSAAGLLATSLALAVFFPDVALLAVVLAVLSLALPLAVQPAIQELATTLRTHAGALSSFYLDALRGLTAIRAQRAETSLRIEHQAVLDRWLEAGRTFTLRVVGINSLQSFVGLTLAVAMVFMHTQTHGLNGGVLLLTYWALALPGLGGALALAIERLPDFRTLTARFAEPLEAPDELLQAPEAASDSSHRAPPADTTPVKSSSPGRGVQLRFDAVDVVASGHTLLRSLDAAIEPGERIAVLGASGAGKSTFLSLLLGWHRAARGRVLVDGAELGHDLLEDLRQRTAWVDPAVTLWDRSLLDNLRYGASDSAADRSVDAVSRAAQLRDVIAGLPDGLATLIGEDGGRLSGGEGQRVRLARALARRGADLVVLDEPFRGLERLRRRALLQEALDWWQGATLLCATHDLEAAALFDRVAVIRRGQLVELDTPSVLRSRPTSLYAGLLQEEARRRALWDTVPWRRLWMEDGQLRVPPDSDGPSHGASVES